MSVLLSHLSVSPTCQQMSLAYPGQQHGTGQDDDVRALMTNEALLATDWVRLIWVNYGIIFQLIHYEMSVNARLLPGNGDCRLLLSR